MPSPATAAAQSALAAYNPLGSNDALTKSNDQYGVGEANTRLSALKSIVGNLQSSVESVDPSVTGRTSGTFTTEGQRQALVSKEQAPILGNLGKQQAAETAQQGDVTQKQGLAQSMATALLNDDKAKYQRLLDVYNQNTAQDQAAEAKAQADRAFAEQQRQFNVSQAAAAAAAAKSASSGGGRAAAAPKVTVASLFEGYNPKTDKYYTENVVIPALVKAGLSPAAASKQAYDYRRQVFKE